MAPTAGLGPLAAFTKDWILTAKGGDMLKRLSMIYSALSKLEQRDEGAAAYSGLDAIAAGISESNEIRLSKDPVCIHRSLAFPLVVWLSTIVSVQEVRLMLSCVVAESFRLCAPDPPFPTPITLVSVVRALTEDFCPLDLFLRSSAGHVQADVQRPRCAGQHGS